MNRATSATGWARNPDGSPGWTWNPITGCLNHDNGLCKGGGFPCYAYRRAHGRLKRRYLQNLNIALPHENPKEAFDDPFYPRFWPERLSDIPQNWKVSSVKPRGIFICDMSDLFGIGIPEQWTAWVMEQIKLHPEHRFYLLTKQPQNLARWSPFPDNCYVGVTATNGKMLWYAMKHLKAIQAKVKFLSLEPLLEAIPNDAAWPLLDSMGNCDISWLIIGGQTKPTVLPSLESLQEIVEAADKADIRVFLKDNLLELVNYHSPDTEFAFNKDGCYRQEMPEEVKQ